MAKKKAAKKKSAGKKRAPRKQAAAGKTARAKKKAPRRGTKKNITAEILKKYRAGATLTELKTAYGIKGKTQLASAVFDALVSSGKIPAVRRGRKPKAKVVPTEFAVKVNKRGTIVLPKEAVIDSFRAAEGQAFVARRRGKKIILTAE